MGLIRPYCAQWPIPPSAERVITSCDWTNRTRSAGAIVRLVPLSSPHRITSAGLMATGIEFGPCRLRADEAAVPRRRPRRRARSEFSAQSPAIARSGARRRGPEAGWPSGRAWRWRSTVAATARTSWPKRRTHGRTSSSLVVSECGNDAAPHSPNEIEVPRSQRDTRGLGSSARVAARWRLAGRGNRRGSRVILTAKPDSNELE
jgi:hypothetical protein